MPNAWIKHWTAWLASPAGQNAMAAAKQGAKDAGKPFRLGSLAKIARKSYVPVPATAVEKKKKAPKKPKEPKEEKGAKVKLEPMEPGTEEKSQSHPSESKTPATTPPTPPTHPSGLVL